MDGFLLAFREPYKQLSDLGRRNLPIHVIKVFDYMKNNSEMFRLLFSDNAFLGFREKLCEVVERVVFTELNFIDSSFEKIDTSIYARTQAYSFIGLISYWVEHNFHIPSTYIADQYQKIHHYSPKNISSNPS
ncbi:TetR-like C-terminal domain-containing protein [Peribacillus muralis]|uniref:TetR-like C-terminal domain-containing protein n=1 Tax=Peribacillus muralis TaxID=264697 RepID=UPI0035A28A8E